MKPLRARLTLICPVFSTQPLSRATGLQFECQRIGSRKNRWSRLSAERIAVLCRRWPSGARPRPRAPVGSRVFRTFDLG
jgi:hypothetical protein